MAFSTVTSIDNSDNEDEKNRLLQLWQQQQTTKERLLLTAMQEQDPSRADSISQNNLIFQINLFLILAKGTTWKTELKNDALLKLRQKLKKLGPIAPQL